MASQATAAQATKQTADIKVNHVVLEQLCKTKMCTKFAKGNCNDPNCCFAHSASELRPKMDLSKTRMCRMFSKGACSKDNCKFAHNEQELRVTLDVYKTQLCNFYRRGHCKKGNQCRHAHGDHELRKEPPASPTESDDTRWPSEDNTDGGDLSPTDSARGEVPAPYEAAAFEPGMLPPFTAPRLPPAAFPRSALVQSVPTYMAEISDPMKIPLPTTSPEPLREMTRQAQLAHSQLSTSTIDEMLLYDKVAQLAEVQRQTAAMAGFLGDGYPSGVGSESEQVLYARQIVKACELEFQAALLKAQQQMKEAVMLAAAGHIGNSMVHVDGVRGSHFEALVGNTLGRSQMHAYNANSMLPPGLY